MNKGFAPYNRDYVNDHREGDKFFNRKAKNPKTRTLETIHTGLLKNYYFLYRRRNWIYGDFCTKEEWAEFAKGAKVIKLGK